MSSRLLAAVALASPLVLGAPFPGCDGGTLAGCPGTPNCSVAYFTQPVDHFNWAPPLGNASAMTYQQRYFVNQQWWDPGSNGPIFFYFGNEDNVELYVNHTGLMWESAAEFKVGDDKQKGGVRWGLLDGHLVTPPQYCGGRGRDACLWPSLASLRWSLQRPPRFA
jgi:hypothetical protein